MAKGEGGARQFQWINERTCESLKGGKKTQPFECRGGAHLQLDGDGLHPQRVFVKGVKGFVPHDVRLGNVAAPAPEREQRLVQLHRFICGKVDFYPSRRNLGGESV